MLFYLFIFKQSLYFNCFNSIPYYCQIRKSYIKNIRKQCTYSLNIYFFKVSRGEGEGIYIYICYVYIYIYMFIYIYNIYMLYPNPNNLLRINSMEQIWRPDHFVWFKSTHIVSFVLFLRHFQEKNLKIITYCYVILSLYF